MAKKRKLSTGLSKVEEPETDLQEKKVKVKQEPSVSEEEKNDENTEENPQQGPGESEDEDEHEIDTKPFLKVSVVDEESIDKLLEPFSKEQLVLLVREAVEKYPRFVENIRKIADADPTHRKIFVYGLGWDTTAETLINAFGRYGDIEDCKAVSDKITGKSKGYAFILFKHRSGACNALKEPQKKIGNRIASCQLASTGPVTAPASLPIAQSQPASEYTQRKIFISNVSPDIDPKKLHEFFSKYGEIEEGPLGIDKITGKFKGFTLFVYKSLESARKALEEPHKNYEGHLLHCQKAIDGPKIGKPLYNQTQYFQPQSSIIPARKEKGQYSAGVSAPGHLMAPSGPPVGFNAGASVAAPGLNPAIGQALTALLASQGAGLGLGNLLGTLGGAGNQSVTSLVGHGIPGGYLSQNPVAYGAQSGIQGGYQNPQIGQVNAVRPPQGGPPYIGH